MKLIQLLPFFSFASALPHLSLQGRNSNQTHYSPKPSEPCNPKTKFFNQTLNHQGPSNETFQQRYQLVDEFFKPGGPILFYQGAETPTFTCVESSSLYQFAKELGGLAIGLEHRFFGQSVPFGLKFADDAEWPTEDLLSLTLDNVLLDSVRFIEWIQSTVPGAAHSKAIVFGGSYGGFLSTMLRVHHPETFYGSITSSGVGNGLASSPYDPNLYLQSQFLERVYLEASAEVSGLVRTGMKTLEQQIVAGNFSNFASELNLCYPPNATNQYPQLAAFLISSFYSVAQYNYDIGLPGAPAFPFKTFISSVSSNNTTDSPFVALAAASKIGNQISGQTCGDWNSKARGGGQTIPFAWILCTYFPYTDNVFTSSSSVFGAYLPDTTTNNVNDQLCQSSFGIPAVSAEGIREKYKITQPQLEGLARIIFAEGMVDPVTALGPSPFYVGNGEGLSESEKAKMIFISGTGHGEDLFAEFPNDSSALKSARKAELESIKEWLS